MLKRICSILLATVIILCISVVAVNAEGTSKLYFEVPESWEHFSRVYCHIWEYGGSPLSPWQSKKQICTQVEDNLYSYDTTLVGGLTEGKYYGVIFSVDIGLQTYDLLMSTDCLGSTAYCNDEYYYSPQDTAKYVLPAYWRGIDSEIYGPVKFISGTGDIQGTCFAPDRPAMVLLTEFIDLWIDKACVIKNESEAEIITRLGAELGLNEMEISQAVYNAQIPVSWDYPENFEPFTPATEDELPTEIIVDNTVVTIPKDEEIITYYVNLKTPEKLEDIQATISYDSRVLEVVSCNAPNLTNSIINYRDPGYIYFNAVDINPGMDFTDNKLLIEVDFKIIDEGKTDISISFVEMNALRSDKYFYFGEQLNDNVIVTEGIVGFYSPEVPDESVTSATDKAEIPDESVTSATDKAEVPADIVETGTNRIWIVYTAVVISTLAVFVLIKKKAQ